MVSLSSTSIAENYFSQKLGFFVIVPDGWGVDSSAADEIVLTDSRDNSTYVSIKKYRIEEDKQIGSEADLLQAIEGLYRNLGIKVDSSNRIKYAVSDGKAVFEAEFADRYQAGKVTNRKYLSGTICRTSDDGQVLFLMIASAPEDMYGAAFPEISVISKSFHVTAQIMPNLYPRTNMVKFLLIFIVIALSIFFFTRNRKIQRSSNPLGRDSSNFWRCTNCGRVNHNDARFCHRCGAERPIIHLPRGGGHSSINSTNTPEHDKG